MLDNLLNIFQGFFLIKLGFLIICGIFTFFLFIVYKQAKAMNRVIIDGNGSGLVNSVALFNLFVGILIFVAALIIL